MHRFYADENGLQNGLATLDSEDARHAARVLRLQAGAQIVLYALGRAYSAELTAVGEAVTCRVLAELPSSEPSVRVTLYQGVPKGDKMDYIVQKCTEGGIDRIVPVNMPRCVAKLAANDDKKCQRWQRIAREATKQAFRPRVPEIGAPVELRALPALLERHALALVPWEDARDGSIRQLAQNVSDIALVIGPEGGMSAADVAPLLQAGAKTVSLGPRILRTETAGLAALFSIMTVTGNLE